MFGGPLIRAITAIADNDLLGAFGWIVVLALLLLIAFPVHEMAHALVAKWLGDDTGEREGRITLNPIAHLDPIGAILFALFGFGWAKPVPVNLRYLNGNPRTSFAIVALAGPVSNILLAALFAIIFRVVLPIGASETVLNTLVAAVSLNIFLALFNLIPVPPLDGSRILAAALPDSAQGILDQLSRYGFLIVLALSYTGLFSLLIGQPTNQLTRAFIGL
jgi:Zn-dependent protease